MLRRTTPVVRRRPVVTTTPLLFLFLLLHLTLLALQAQRRHHRKHGFVEALSSSSSSPSGSSSSSPSPKIFQQQQQLVQQQRYPFRSFEFAENGVCVNPFYFRCASDDDNNDDDMKKGSTAGAVPPSTDQTTSPAPAPKIRMPSVFTMKNVPGDGDCMFLAVALAAAASMGLGGNDALLRAISKETRDVVARIFEQGGGDGGGDGGDCNLYIDERNKCVKASALLKNAARQEGVTPETYLKMLRGGGDDDDVPRLYGGGPELAVLSNVLRRPISIYHLVQERQHPDVTDIAANNDPKDEIRSCPIQCVGTFGTPLFEDPCQRYIPNSAVLSGVQAGAFSWHLHILVVDAGPNEKHACVLLPQDL